MIKRSLGSPSGTFLRSVILRPSSTILNSQAIRSILPSNSNNSIQKRSFSTFWTKTYKFLNFIPIAIPPKLEKKLQDHAAKECQLLPLLPKSTTLSVWRALGGNFASFVLKMIAYRATGSSAMFAEALHAFVDTTNQGLLLVGMWQTQNAPDRSHPYGYGKSAFVWSLISAMGTFWMGSALSIYTGVSHLMSPTGPLDFGPWSLFALVSSFLLDGYVLSKTLGELKKSKPENVSLLRHAFHTKDPFVNAVLLEDMAGTTGAVIALTAVVTSFLTGNVIYDSLGTIGVGTLLALVSLRLMSLNTKYLIGSAIDEKMEGEICQMIMNDPIVESMYIHSLL